MGTSTRPATTFHLAFNPILPWPALALAALAVVGLTLWVYRDRLRASPKRARWVALGLRVAALILCLMAALRPTVVLLEKVHQPTSIVFLIDQSASMKINDEVGNHKRIDS